MNDNRNRSLRNQEQMDSNAKVAMMGLDGNKNTPSIVINKKKGRQNGHRKHKKHRLDCGLIQSHQWASIF